MNKVSRNDPCLMNDAGTRMVPVSFPDQVGVKGLVKIVVQVIPACLFPEYFHESPVMNGIGVTLAGKAGNPF